MERRASRRSRLSEDARALPVPRFLHDAHGAEFAAHGTAAVTLRPASVYPRRTGHVRPFRKTGQNKQLNNSTKMGDVSKTPPISVPR